MRRILAFVAALAAFGGVAARAQNPSPEAHSIIAKMADRNASLNSYKSRVHVDVRMLNFPFLSPKLDGTTYYKRPDNFEVVFDRVPSYAKGFERLFTDIGDPLGWEKDQNVTFEGTQTLNGRPMLVLRLTKKIHSTILDHSIAYVDPQSFELWQMEWHYTSGGAVTMRQWYRSEGSYSVLSQQHADIDIPHVHAVADSTYGPYAVNAPVESSVFTKQ